MNQDEEITMTDDDILWAYNQYLKHLEWLEAEELELQYEQAQAYALYGV
jgi:hypothetical protein